MNTDTLFFNGNLAVPGLVGDITKYLVNSTPFYAPNLSLGSAIALVGAITGIGWQQPNMALSPGPRTPKYPAAQSVILVSKGCVGEEENIDLVDSLICEIDDALKTEIGELHLAVINHATSHLAYAGFETERGNVQAPKTVLPTRHKKRLQENEMSLLARTQFEALSEGMPYWYELSPFFGECLFVPYYGLRLRRSNGDDSQVAGYRNETLVQLLKLADQACAMRESPMEVQVTRAAKALYYELCGMRFGVVNGNERIPANTQFQAMSVASILAVGVNPHKPVVDDHLMGVGARLAMESVYLAHTALGPVPPYKDPELV